MKGSTQITTEPRPIRLNLSRVNRNAWPFEITKGHGKGRIAFIFNDRSRKQICYLDTLCREDVDWVLQKGDPLVRMLDEGERIELTVSS